MRTLSQNAAILRAEARLVGVAGAILLAFGLPLALVLTSLALTGGSIGPFAPALLGAPPIIFGYLACRYASARLVRARAVERFRR